MSELFTKLLAELDQFVPGARMDLIGRERALVITKLQEAFLWAQVATAKAQGMEMR